MRNGGDWLRAVSRFAIVGVVGGVTTACSTDRMAGGNPLANPFSSEPTRTGSLAPESPPAAAPFPRSTVSSQPIAPIQSSPVPVPAYPAASSSTPAAQPRTASGGAGWSTTGGTTVIVGPGETLTTLSSRYGVPGDAILSANSLKSGDVGPGRRVVIPVYSASGNAPAPAPAPARRAEVVAPVSSPVRYNAPPPAPMPARVVASQKIDVKKEPPRTVAEAAPPKSQLRPGQAKVAAVPAPARVAEVKPAAAAPAPATPQKVAAKPVAKPPVQVAKVEPKPAAKAEVKVAKAEPVQKEVILPARKVAAKPAPAPKVEVAKVEPKAAPVKVAEPVKAAEPVKVAEPAKTPVRDPETTASLPAPAPPSNPSSGADFRWPARGRVITGFGSGSNEGINIAVPEGTPVKAAGDGVVAYAGSEVKGYGNLVLIRHDNGYVSAYANNGQIDVKRGQRVNRGHTIAKSGQTGNVTSPQLHFEIRKGSTPVDPMKYLASAE